MSVKNRAAKLKRHLRSCAGKFRHPSRDAAVGALLSLARKRGAVSGQMTAYKCLACGAWHFGHGR